MNWQTIKVRFEEPVCFIQINRPEANNAVNVLLIEECSKALALCEEKITIVVFEGLPEVFCFGADFKEINAHKSSNAYAAEDPGQLYDLWLKMATGPYITISHVRGKANAGGVGFVAASDIVLADTTAQFSLSELLFGLFPACVLPFLIRKIGFQKANYLTLMTKPVLIQQAAAWGLVDAYLDNSESLLRQHLLRLKKLSKTGILRYKRYMGELNNMIFKFKELAVSANREVFSDPQNLKKIYQFVEDGIFPWER